MLSPSSATVLAHAGNLKTKPSTRGIRPEFIPVANLSNVAKKL
jgi:hypothetical protein